MEHKIARFVLLDFKSLYGMSIGNCKIVIIFSSAYKSLPDSEQNRSHFILKWSWISYSFDSYKTLFTSSIILYIAYFNTHTNMQQAPGFMHDIAIQFFITDNNSLLIRMPTHLFSSKIILSSHV